MFLDHKVSNEECYDTDYRKPDEDVEGLHQVVREKYTTTPASIKTQLMTDKVYTQSGNIPFEQSEDIRTRGMETTGMVINIQYSFLI